MMSLLQEVRERLLAGDAEFRHLAEEHSRYESQLEQLSKSPYLSAEEHPSRSYPEEKEAAGQRRDGEADRASAPSQHKLPTSARLSAIICRRIHYRSMVVRLDGAPCFMAWNGQRRLQVCSSAASRRP